MPSLFPVLLVSACADAPLQALEPGALFDVAAHRLDPEALVSAVATAPPVHRVLALWAPTLHHDDALQQALPAALARIAQRGLACALFSQPLEPGLHAVLAAEGVHAWGDLRHADAAAVRAVLAQAEAVHSQCGELGRLRAQLDERKWVDRAKGRLMAAGGLAEDEAFRLLRNAAMHLNLRLGEIARGVVEGAQWAEALNRAGQLRMLSQRLLCLAAQPLAGVDVRRAPGLRAQAAERVRQNIDHLAALPLDAACTRTLDRARSAWQVLDEALRPRLTRAGLAKADARAEALLEAAEGLTLALEAAAGRRALRIVNLSGSQRMRALRLAKDALLACLQPEGPWAARLQPTMDAFDAVARELEQAPLSTPEIRAGLAAAREQWLRLARGLQSAAQPEGRAELVAASEALAETFEGLTAAYEHSVQVIMS